MKLHFGGPVIHPSVGVACSLGALAALNLAVFFWLTGYLRDRHPEKWEALRCPEIFGGPQGSRWRLLGFVWGRDITQMNDAALAVSAWTARAATVAFLAIAAWQYWLQYR